MVSDSADSSTPCSPATRCAGPAMRRSRRTRCHDAGVGAVSALSALHAAARVPRGDDEVVRRVAEVHDHEFVDVQAEQSIAASVAASPSGADEARATARFASASWTSSAQPASLALQVHSGDPRNRNAGRSGVPAQVPCLDGPRHAPHPEVAVDDDHLDPADARPPSGGAWRRLMVRPPRRPRPLRPGPAPPSRPCATRPRRRYPPIRGPYDVTARLGATHRRPGHGRADPRERHQDRAPDGPYPPGPRAPAARCRAAPPRAATTRLERRERRRPSARPQAPPRSRRPSIRGALRSRLRVRSRARLPPRRSTSPTRRRPPTTRRRSRPEGPPRRRRPRRAPQQGRERHEACGGRRTPSSAAAVSEHGQYGSPGLLVECAARAPMRLPMTSASPPGRRPSRPCRPAPDRGFAAASWTWSAYEITKSAATAASATPAHERSIARRRMIFTISTRSTRPSRGQRRGGRRRFRVGDEGDAAASPTSSRTAPRAMRRPAAPLDGDTRLDEPRTTVARDAGSAARRSRGRSRRARSHRGRRGPAGAAPPDRVVASDPHSAPPRRDTRRPPWAMTRPRARSPRGRRSSGSHRGGVTR